MTSRPGGTSLARAGLLAREARERGAREGNAGRPAAGARYIRAGLRQLGWRPGGAGQVAQEHRSLAARMLMTLAGWESELGRAEDGLRLLDEAGAMATAADQGLLCLQRGLILMRTGQERAALPVLDDAAALLQADPAETANLATALLNRSFAHLNLGQVRQARADLLWCRRLATERGHDLIVAKALHNLGYCDLLAGNIPAALQLFTAAAAAYRHSAPGFLLVLATDKARALLAAGLAGDAAAELDAAMAASRRQRLDQNLAEAQLTRAQAALAAGDFGAARGWATAAGRRFQRRGNHSWACLAELIQLRARSPSPGTQAPGMQAPGTQALGTQALGTQAAAFAARAVQLARRLRRCGLASDADMADLLAARALVTAGRPGEARQLIGSVRRGRDVPLAVRLMRRLARAELAELDGRTGRALAELRAGLAMVQVQRGRLGSIDLQTGTAALGADLAAAGLRLALDRKSASLVFAWLERSRAQAFRVRPVLPPADPAAASLLAELRQLSYLIRVAELNGTRDPVTVARHAELRRQIREYGWQASGAGAASGQARQAGKASLGEVSGALQETAQVLVGILVRDGAMRAIVLRRGSARLVQLGDFELAAEAARRLTVDLDTVAGRLLPARLQAVIADSMRHQAELLTTEIVAPLRPWLGDDAIVIVPAGPLAGIPWGALPGLRGRPVTVCPSASAWLAARERELAARERELAAAGPGLAEPVLVAGPDLKHAVWEVTEIAKTYPRCRVLTGDEAITSATLRALSGAPLAHLAAHGHHDRENVLFSRLDLADGPLMAYDIQQLASAPRHVVLSSCDVGRTVVRPGDEMLGFTAALLYLGTTTVVSSVTRVADAAAVGVMTAYHRLLAAGIKPAEALAEAALAEEFSPFVCFGAG